MKNKILLLLLVFVASVGQVLAQQKTITGVVTDETDAPVPGVNIIVEGTTTGTITDFDGKYSINAPVGGTLVFNFIGYTAVKMPVTGAPINVKLEPESTGLEEVVAIGYGGSKARKDLTGSVGSISGAKLAAVPVTSAAVAMQGKIAGVQVTSVDGQPGADINIRVRGGASVTSSNDPLFIVDGFQQDNINDIPPTDIASIDVLRDASLTAIYGAKGGNGVVVVTTKSAQSGKISVDLNANVSVSTRTKKLELMNTYDFIKYQYERAACNGVRSTNAKYFRYNFGNPQDIELYKGAETHDWQDEVMNEKPVNYSTNLVIKGGNEKLRVNFSITQSQDRGIIIGSGVRRTNLNFKMNANLLDNLTFAWNPKMTYRRDEGAGGDNVGTGGIIDVLRYRPTNGNRDYIQWAEGTVNSDEEADFAYNNPKNDVATNTQKKHSYSVSNQISLEWRPAKVKGLTLRSDVGLTLGFSDKNRFYGELTSTGKSNNSQPVAQIDKSQSLKYTWTNTVSYNTDVNDLHNLSFILGHEVTHSESQSSTIKNRYFPRGINADKAWANMNLGTPWVATTNNSTPVRLLSFFGQASYNFDHKYFFSVTYRADESSKFADGNRWGHFPSVAGAWAINKESFWSDNISTVNTFKLRVAFGLAGNNNIGNDLYHFLYSSQSEGGPGFGENTDLGEQYYSSANGAKYFNPNIKWETTITRNLAFDMGFLDDRITFTPEVYWNTTRDMLYQSDIPSTSGYTSQVQNIGQVTNKGFEITLSGDILRGKDYVLSANLTMGYNKKIIDELNASTKLIEEENSRWKSKLGGDYRLEVGKEIGLIYGFEYDGVFGFDEFNYQGSKYVPKTMALDGYRTLDMSEIFDDSNSGSANLPGKIKFKDKNGDGKINKDDRVVIGNTNPKLQGGFGFTGTYKNFDAAINFNYMLGFDVVNATAYALSSAGTKNCTVANYKNVLKEFASKGHAYCDFTLKACEPMNTASRNDIDLNARYQEINKGRNLWNPGDVVNNVMHSYFVEDGSFLRCQDITVGYTMPKDLSSKAHMSKVRFYFSCSNPFIITKYTGYDPEVDIQTGLTPGMDYNRYPRSRGFVLGTNITF